jgi:hypothetical protein
VVKARHRTGWAPRVPTVAVNVPPAAAVITGASTVLRVMRPGNPEKVS